MAMALDRMTHAFATRDRPEIEQADRPNPWLIGVCMLVAMWVLSLLAPFLNQWPDEMVLNPAAWMNDALESFIVTWKALIEGFKNSSFFFVMLPIKIGLINAVSPFTWGFAMTPAVIAGYAFLVFAIAAYLFSRGQVTASSVAVLIGALLYVGLTNAPWFALVAIITYSAYVAAGRGLAIGTAIGLGFLMIAGIWPQSALSIYLCGVAVLLCFTIGTSIGVWASENDTVSAILRPILDTLQTMPLFVILIPFVMVFKISESTALLAIMAYAIVPAIRYTEHGIRNLPETVLEAATTIGATRWQLLYRVKLPLALPAIMLGLNQTIIYAIGMLVIAALVGTNGLGQQIYIGLGDGNFGVGMTAGIGMAIIAIIADRVTQAISRRRQAELGLAASPA